MKLRFWLQTNKIGSLVETWIEVDDEDWVDLDDTDREALAKEIFWDEALARLGDWDWETDE